MELAFEKNAVDHLQKLVCQAVSQEETAETVVPDSLPDVGRIVGCWGIPVIRSKEWAAKRHECLRRRQRLGFIRAGRGRDSPAGLGLSAFYREVGISTYGAGGADPGLLPAPEH